MFDLSVIIVNYNSSHFLQLCLEALAVALKGFDAETIVVDNQSQDDSCALIKRAYPWVKLIENTSNEGFGKANNRGIALAKGRHILLLNPDTIVCQGTLHQSIIILDRAPENGAVGVKMLDGSGGYLPESKRGLPMPEVAFYKAFGLTKLFPHSKRFARYYLGHLSPDKETEVEVLAGAYMMCKAEVLKACQGFDEDFFMYGEDIDLSYRITQKGYKIFYSPDFPIIHFKGESSGRDAAWAKRFYDAMHLFSEKHFSNQGWVWSQILNLGIHFRKMLSTSAPVVTEKLELSALRLLVVGATEEPERWDKMTRQFQSSTFQEIDAVDFSQGDAVMFLPHVAPHEVIALMQKQAGQKGFFFALDDFVLTSPSSLSQGEIYRL